MTSLRWVQITSVASSLCERNLGVTLAQIIPVDRSALRVLVFYCFQNLE